MFIPRNLFQMKPIDGSSTFEEEFSKYIGVKSVVTCSSGRSALFHILNFLNIGKGDEVVLPVFTDSVVPTIVRHLSAKPVFVDVRRDFTIDPNLIDKRITKKTKAVIAVHLFGKSCELQSISNICKSRDLPLIEDCAHSVGGKVKNKRLGSVGDFGYFSFNFGKDVCACGGGAISTNHEEFQIYWNGIKDGATENELKTKFKARILHILTSKPTAQISLFPILLTSSIFGFKGVDQFFAKPTLSFKPDNLELREYSKKMITGQLKNLEKMILKRVDNAKIYERMLEIDNSKRPKLSRDHTFHKYTVLVEKRDRIKKILIRKGVDVGTDYSYICNKLFGDGREYPNAKSFSRNVLNLPVYSELCKDEIEYICNNLNRLLNN